MNHQQAVDTLKALPKHKRWTATKAMSVIQCLDRNFFTSPTDFAEAVTAALIGQRWESVHGKQGYDTASTLTRWLGKGASEYGNPAILFDAKTQRTGVGYSEKVHERASKATDFLDRREAGGVINGVVFHTRHGSFFQLGIDHESTTPQFGKRKRLIVEHVALPRLIDGEGGILPAILLSSNIKWNGDAFDGLEKLAVQEVNRRLVEVLKTVLGGVDMQKLQKHLDEQAKKAIKQATDKMLKNKTARNIVAEEVALNPEAVAQATDQMMNNKTARDIVVEKVAANPEAVAQATDQMMNNKTARDIVAERVALNPEAVAQATDQMMNNKTARDIVAEKVAANPKALETALQDALASGKLAEFLITLSPKQKQQIKSLLG